MSSFIVKHSRLWRVLFGIFAVFLAVLIPAISFTNSYKSLITSVIGGTTSKLVQLDGEETPVYYDQEDMTLEEWIGYAGSITEEVAGEGAVLLENKNNALPLPKNAKVSVFSRSSVDLVYTGGGAGANAAAVAEHAVNLKDSWEGRLQINPVLWDFYSQFTGSSYGRMPSGFGGGGSTDFYLHEIDPDAFTGEVKSSYADYNAAAIVVITRVGGEGHDMPQGTFGDGSKYLALQNTERKLLDEVTANFDKVVVLINSSNAMELGWLEEYEQIKACLWVGGPGVTGFKAVGDLLIGNKTPSGKLVNVYAYDSFSAPAVLNSGDFTYANAAAITAAGIENATKYLVEAEGIYVGYRYYETRYEDFVLKQGNAGSDKGIYAGAGTQWDYGKEVQYSFGYGQSYTSFTQQLNGIAVGEEEIKVNVTVKNTGTLYSGKEVVQVYAQSEYTEYDRLNGVEKPSAELVGFAKTDLLKPGQSQTVTVTVDKRDLAAYDYQGEGSYILEAGTYHITIGNGAHDALNNILAKKGKTVANGMDYNGDAGKVETFRVSSNDKTFSRSVTKADIVNRFEEADLNYYSPGTVTYLSRSDWRETWPDTYGAITATAKMMQDLDTPLLYEADANSFADIITGEDNKLTVAMLIGLDYTDPLWDKLLNQMSLEDYANIAMRSGLAAIESVAYPTVYMKDGPVGIAGSRTYTENGKYPMTYPAQPVTAATFNVELAALVGFAFGEDGLRTETVGNYAPGANIHRTPYSGRNFEYYSEDPVLSSYMLLHQSQAAMEKGLICYTKHFAFNDQETNRQGVSIFNNEQALRQIYLRGFERAFSNPDGGINGAMNSFTRVGCIWVGAHKGFMTDVTRREWGFEGIMDTDIAFSAGGYRDPKAGLQAGTTMWATSGTAIYNGVIDDVKSDVQLQHLMREAAHRVLYVVANSAGFNGISVNTKVVVVMPYWQIILVALLAVLSVAAVGSAAFLVFSAIKSQGTYKGAEK